MPNEDSQESYHNYMLRRMKEDRMEYQGDLFLHGMTQCAECGNLLHKDEAREHIYYNEHGQQVETFCPDKLQPEQSCHDKWYLEHLRRGL